MNETEHNSDTLYRIYFIFAETVMLTYDSYTGDEKEKIQEFIIEFARNYTPYGLIKVDTIPEVVDHIFTVDSYRDFVWKLIFNFYSTVGLEKSENEMLCQVLSTSLDITDNSAEENVSLTPSELKKRSLDADTLYDNLIANKWLVVLVLLLLLYRRNFSENKVSIQSFIERLK